ncbi:molecular chaperone DnaJ [candidate division TA06 bacterium]|nr:molecular chaperone DnaJ [candidate division TA06 bacterium]
MTKRDYYETLGIGRNATEDEIKSAYRRLARKHHPDMNRDNPKEAEEKFKELSEAYEVLMDSNKRATYNQFGHEGLSGSFGRGGFDFSRDFTHISDLEDVIGGLFGGGGSVFDILMGGSQGRRRGGRGRRGERGGDLKIKLPLTLNEIDTGVEKNIRLKRLERCNTCKGTGAQSGGLETCSTCGGSGEIQRVSSGLFGQFINVSACGRCRGEGKIISIPCPICHGKGRVEKETTLSVKIPPGVSRGNYLPLREQGNAGRNGGSPGDVIVLIDEKEDPIFERRDKDIFIRVPISYTLAALGGKIEVPTLTGQVKMKIPSGTQSGKVFRLRGKGLPRLEGYGRGDQLVEIVIWTPKKLSSEEKRLLKELEDLTEKKVPRPGKI